MEKWVTLLLLLVGAARKWVTTEDIASLCTSKSWVLFTGDGPNAARELEKFLWVWVWVSALGE